ncbi:MAG: acyl-CoA dehydrogenase [Pseudonocardiaceae bacterium]|nr:acyl-CoA dehydrogenase [Pseudonocardiaceae bacterium]
MDFELTQDQHDIQRAVRELAASFGNDYWAEHDHDHRFPWEFYDAFAHGGWLGIQEASILLEEVAASGAAMNGCSAMHLTIFGINVLVKHGSEALRAEILPGVVDGSLHVCFGVTEPDAGTDTSRITTTARRDGDSYVVHGRKVWTTKAGDSQKIVLLARTSPRDDASPTDGMSLFLADVDRSAMEITPIAKMGRNAVASHEVRIDGLRVPAAARIGEEGDGFRYLLDGLNPERILLAHEALGIGRVAIEHATEYATQREVFGRPIGQNQGLAFPLAEAQTRLDAARLMARNAAWRYDNGLRCGREANMAKFLCADAGFEAADRAVQTLGGMGYAREYHVERYFREARLIRLAPISQEMVLNYVSQHVLGLPRSY